MCRTSASPAVESRAATCGPHLPAAVRRPTARNHRGGALARVGGGRSFARSLALGRLPARPLGALAAATRRTAAKAWPRCLRIALPRRSRRRPGHPRRPAARSRHALSYRHHRGEHGARSLCPMEIRTSTVRHVRGNTCWATTRFKRATVGRHRETPRDVAGSRRCPSGTTSPFPPFLSPFKTRSKLIFSNSIDTILRKEVF